MDITELTVHELQEKLKNKELTITEITKAYTDRIKEKEKAGSESSFVYDLNDTENAELNKYYDNRKKAKAKKQKEIFGY